MSRAVVKLGGSTAHAAEMGKWIAALAGSSPPVVIVPGGGIGKAHAMAILAMEQFGHIVLDRHERLVPARSLDEMERALENGRTPVWLPSSLATPAPDIPASWDITSDALAAWLAGKLGADALLLIKQTGAFSDSDTIAGLAARGIIDAGLAAMLPEGVDFHLAGPQDATAAAAMLLAGRLPGVRLASSVRPARKAG